jgi:hypothetical protein
MQQQIEPNADPSSNARREFLAKCGRLAVVTPPAVTLMLAASQRNFAVAQSGGARGGRNSDADFDRPRSRGGRNPNNGFGNGGGDGVPGRSLHDDLRR